MTTLVEPRYGTGVIITITDDVTRIVDDAGNLLAARCKDCSADDDGGGDPFPAAGQLARDASKPYGYRLLCRECWGERVSASRKRARPAQPPRAVRLCDVDGCTRKHRALGPCPALPCLCLPLDH